MRDEQEAQEPALTKITEFMVAMKEASERQQLAAAVAVYSASRRMVHVRDQDQNDRLTDMLMRVIDG